MRLHVDDGRNYLLLTGKRYDVVTADVILPIHAGSGNLYPQSTPAGAAGVKPGGIAVQWVAGTEAEYKTIMRTFLSVFPRNHAVGGGQPDARLGRTAAPAPGRLRLEVPGAGAPRDDGPTRRYDLGDLLRIYVAGPGELRQYRARGRS